MSRTQADLHGKNGNEQCIASMDAIIRVFPNLQRLSIIEAPAGVVQGCWPLLARLPSLQNLSIAGCSGSDDVNDDHTDAINGIEAITHLTP